MLNTFNQRFPSPDCATCSGIGVRHHQKPHYFFAYPFSAWELGTNENINRLIREYFPKHLAFNTITQEDVPTVMDKLNNRPRKRLCFKTPIEVYQSYSIALAS